MVKNNYGYGWIIGEKFNHKVVAHNGGINGFATRIARYPDDDNCIIILANFQGLAVGDVERDLSAMFFGEKYQIPKSHKTIELNYEIYSDYVGEYELISDFIIVVSAENDHIFLEATGQPKVEIFPESNTTFFLKAVDAQVTFVKDEHGKVIELIMHQAGKDMPAKKIR